MKKRIICLVVSLITVFSVCAEASVLGSKLQYSYNYEISDGLKLIKNRFLSDQEGVGNQTENYFIYTPNASTRPIVTLGEYVYGGEDINEIYEYLKLQGIRTVGGVNGDFYSLSTGIPNGHVVIDKKIVSADERTLPALGIREDGTAFVDDFQIITKMLHNETETVIPFINKYLQKWGYYLYDSDFSNETKPESEGIYITLKIIGGEMKIGQALETEFVSLENEITKKEILKDHIIIGLTNEAPTELSEVFNDFEVGDTVLFEFSTNNDEVWEEADYILASEAGQIVKDGEYCGEELAGASPRTAVGITQEGDMVLYTIDGRQTNHSFGTRIPTLAERLKELGCVDVLNLDGGGSTVISATLGGFDSFDLQNSPSDGKLRNDSTYIFFENIAEQTGELTKLFMYPSTVYAKSGAKVNYTLKATDDGFFPVEITEAPEFTVSGDSYIENGEIYAFGDGESYLTATVDEITASAVLKSIETPDYIKVVNENGEEVNSVSLSEGETLELNIIAYYNSMEIISDDSLYEWSVTENAGTVTQDGLFTMGDETGSIIIRAGELTHEISVAADPFSDITKNWARHYINDLYDKGIVNGFNTEDGKFVFKPGNYVTKSEMAAMLSRSLKLETEKYTDVELPFYDADKIPQWALPHVKALYGNGVINGTYNSDGNVYFNPSSEVNRAEIFTITGRILNVEGENPCPFSDREEIPAWAISYIDGLYEKGMINGYSDNELKVYNSITRAEISKIIVKALFST